MCYLFMFYKTWSDAIRMCIHHYESPWPQKAHFSSSLGNSASKRGSVDSYISMVAYMLSEYTHTCHKSKCSNEIYVVAFNSSRTLVFCVCLRF